ncbi:MAG: hypothetical protein IIC57_08865, partial [Proteobacteria bacterium]|nr:hypothetical protein [Pseudomonadota bacterium]
AFVTGGRGRAILTEPWERLPYQVFFTGIALIAFGSAYYHADPTDQTLFWDRLAMTIAYLALLALFIADRVHGPVGVRAMLPLLVGLGVGALIYWRLGEAAGDGDLRFYFLTQIYPALMIPLICLLFPRRHTDGRYVLYLFLCYGLVVGSEWLDHEIYALSRRRGERPQPQAPVRGAGGLYDPHYAGNGREAVRPLIRWPAPRFRPICARTRSP